MRLFSQKRPRLRSIYIYLWRFIALTGLKTDAIIPEVGMISFAILHQFQTSHQFRSVSLVKCGKLVAVVYEWHTSLISNGDFCFNLHKTKFSVHVNGKQTLCRKYNLKLNLFLLIWSKNQLIRYWMVSLLTF